MLHIDVEVYIDLVEDPAAARTVRVEEGVVRNPADEDMIVEGAGEGNLEGVGRRMEPEEQEDNRKDPVAAEDSILPAGLAVVDVVDRENDLGEDIRVADEVNL